MDLNGNIIKEWDSINEAGRTLKIHNISNACNNARKSAGGFKWKFKNNIKI